MRKPDYQNFDLEFYKTGGGYRVKVRSFAGEATQPLALPFIFEQAQEFIVHLERSIGPNRIKTELVKEWGRNLYEAIFVNDIRAIYKSSLDLINAKGGSGLRIRLHFQDVVELSHLPWEYLYQATTNQFLCHNRQTPIVRYLEISKVISPLAIKLPLRILVMISSPQNLGLLDVNHEKIKIQIALADLIKRRLVEITCLELATVAELQKTLRRTEFHIFHFIGHGDFDEKTQQGLLAFENDDEFVNYVKAEQLGAILGNHPSLRLTILNSCQGARTSLINPFAGTATTLVQQGIPAVAAMQFSISDTAAVKFAGEFYAAIADGLPVDMAVTEARVGIFSSEDSLEWGTPVLFMRSADGALFEVEQEKRDENLDAVEPSRIRNNEKGQRDQKSPRINSKKKKPRRAAFAFHTLVLLLFAAVTFVILAVLPKSTIIEIEVFAEQVNFSLPPEIVKGKEISLLHSGFWSKKVSLEEFHAFELIIVSLPSQQTKNAASNPLTISPEPRKGRISFYSPLSDISLQEVICDSGSRVSIAHEEMSASFRIRQSSQAPHLILSLGENVRIKTQACRIVDGAQRDLTPLFENGIMVRLHDVSRSLIAQGQDGELRADADSVESQDGEPAKFILKALVQNLDFLKDVYLQGGKIERSTIDSILVKKNSLLEASSFKSHEAGDLEIKAEPNRFAIYDLRESGNKLKVNAQGRVKSLQIGRGALQSELVPKYLSLIAHNPGISVAMTWLGWFLTVVLPFLVKTKFKHEGDAD